MRRSRLHCVSVAVCGGLVLSFSAPVRALEPPTAEQIRKYKADGTWEKRLARAHELGNDQANPALLSALQTRLQREAAKAAGLPVPKEADGPLNAVAGDGPRALPPAGTQKVLVILID